MVHVLSEHDINMRSSSSLNKLNESRECLNFAVVMNPAELIPRPVTEHCGTLEVLPGILEKSSLRVLQLP